ncbi:hypothetical protein AXE85_06485 [Gemella sp. oral taxon 928]|nr:hypothetical protein AXE85_06485 [Gemella sp. oral taxon 928]
MIRAWEKISFPYYLLLCVKYVAWGKIFYSIQKDKYPNIIKIVKIINYGWIFDINNFNINK